VHSLTGLQTRPGAVALEPKDDAFDNPSGKPASAARRRYEAGEMAVPPGNRRD